MTIYQIIYQSNEFIQWYFGMNIDMRRVLISYSIITVICIRIIFFNTVEMWVNSNTSPIIRLEWNLNPLFFSWWRKHHDYLFYFCKIVPCSNPNWNLNLRRRTMSWASYVDLLCDKYDYWLNFLYKIIEMFFTYYKCKFFIISKRERDIKCE